MLKQTAISWQEKVKAANETMAKIKSKAEEKIAE
jgi:hypothetical protein